MNRAALENARMLSHALGTSAEAAMAFLDRTVVVTTDANGAALAADVVRLLARSVRRVATEPCDGEQGVEVVIGSARAQTPLDRVYVSMSYREVWVASARAAHPHADAQTPSLLVLLTACYVTGAVIRRLVGGALPYPTRDPFTFSPAALLSTDEDALQKRVSLGVVHLAGAGAVGNAFMLALGRFDVDGVVHVADPDIVEEGNLNRTLLFDENDVGKHKAIALVHHAAEKLPHVQLVPHVRRLQELADGGPWLEQLVCTVDSRRARRALQEELPRDVYDASTSGIGDVVLHFNSITAAGSACLACVYHEDRREAAHEEHVATMLGVDVDAVRQSHLSPAAAERVATKHPHLRGRDLVGLSCDTLFKELCATGSLGADSGQQVLAPLAFVSALAGTMLALEVVRRRLRNTPTTPFNEWHLSPWAPPLLEGRRSRPARKGCTFCGQGDVRAQFTTLWQVGDEPDKRRTEED